jgi:hypothetical protein
VAGRVGRGWRHSRQGPVAQLVQGCSKALRRRKCREAPDDRPPAGCAPAGGEVAVPKHGQLGQQLSGEDLQRATRQSVMIALSRAGWGMRRTVGRPHGKAGRRLANTPSDCLGALTHRMAMEHQESTSSVVCTAQAGSDGSKAVREQWAASPFLQHSTPHTYARRKHDRPGLSRFFRSCRR